jgi:hypothetical protein
LKLEAPDPAKGFQLHYGPTNYDDTAEVEKFLLKPGEEKNTCVYMTTPNEQDVFFSDYYATVRPGTHHMIIFAAKSSEKPDGLFEECQAVPGGTFRFMVGAQNGIDPKGAVIQVPEPGKPVAPENEGMAMMLPAKTRIAYSVHFVNQSKTDSILQESWANFFYKPAEEVSQPAATLFWIGGLGMAVKPHSQEVVEGYCENESDVPRRLVTLTGHVHSHTTRFSAYKLPKGAPPESKELVYEIFDWAHADLFYYDTANINPLPDRASKRPGASSGELWLEPGDKITWECDVDNDENYPMRFGNEAYTAEMCNIFGLSAPAVTDTWNCYSIHHSK